MKVLLTGSAGFIGMHSIERLLARGDTVVGVDNLNDYYEVSLKEARLARIASHENFTFHRASVEDKDAMAALFAAEKPDRVIHLAAQAGVRYSLENPHAYIDANLQGFINILEGCRHNGVEHLVYASSSFGLVAAMNRCPSASITVSIIRSRFMPRRRRRTS